MKRQREMKMKRINKNRRRLHYLNTKFQSPVLTKSFLRFYEFLRGNTYKTPQKPDYFTSLTTFAIGVWLDSFRIYFEISFFRHICVHKISDIFVSCDDDDDVSMRDEVWRFIAADLKSISFNTDYLTVYRIDTELSSICFNNT